MWKGTRQNTGRRISLEIRRLFSSSLPLLFPVPACRQALPPNPRLEPEDLLQQIRHCFHRCGVVYSKHKLMKGGLRHGRCRTAPSATATLPPPPGKGNHPGGAGLLAGSDQSRRSPNGKAASAARISSFYPLWPPISASLSTGCWAARHQRRRSRKPRFTSSSMPF